MPAEEKMGDRGDEKAQAESTLIQPEEKMGDGEDKKCKAESALIQPEEKTGDGEDKKDKADDITADSSGLSKSSGTDLDPFSEEKWWYRVSLGDYKLRHWQEAMMLDFLKCDKSELPSLYQYSGINTFEAYLTINEAKELRCRGGVAHVIYFRKRDKSVVPKRTKYANPNPIKKQKFNSAIKISEHRKNEEKWKYIEDSNVEDSEEEFSAEDDYSSDDDTSSRSWVCYMPFDESGRRWYKVHLENDKSCDDQMALLVDVLKRESSEILYIRHGENSFEVVLTEEEAEKVAGVRDVEFAEPRRYFFALE